MKNILILIAFLFSVVCYAAPPPTVAVHDFHKVQYVVQDNVTVNTFDAQEVAFYRIGYVLNDSQNHCLIKPLNKFKTSDMIFVENRFEILPMVFDTGGVISSEYALFLSQSKPYANLRLLDRQNSNYAYPFGANFIF